MFAYYLVGKKIVWSMLDEKGLGVKLQSVRESFVRDEPS